MANISKIALNGTSYDIKDSVARAALEKEKKYLFIGDSYMAGIDPEGSGQATLTSFVTRALNRTGINGSYLARGGEGFAHFGVNGNFLSRLQEYAGDKDSITDIIVMGGYNDYTETYDSIGQAIEQFMNYAKVNFVNAKVTIAFIAWSKMPTRFQGFARAYRAYTNYNTTHGYGIIPNIQYALHDTECLGSDQIHPNNLGQITLANYLVHWLEGSPANVTKGYTVINYSLVDNVTYSNIIMTTLNDGLATIESFSPGSIGLDLTRELFNGYRVNRFQIATILSNSNVLGSNDTGDVTTADATAGITVPANFLVDGNWVSGSCTIEVISAGIFVNPIITNSSGFIGGHLTAIYLPSWHISCNSMFN